MSVIDLTKDVGLSYFNSYNYFRELSLLFKSIAQELVKQGYKTGNEQYYLPYAIRNTDGREGFTVNKEFMARFYDKQLSYDEQWKQVVHYGYGILFKETNPESQINPWLPFLHFFKGELNSPDSWDSWAWNNRIVDAAIYNNKDFGSNYLIQLIPLQHEFLSDLSDKIKSISIVAVPIGGLQSTEDISNIILPIVKALQTNDEKYLDKIKLTYLIYSIND